jgi:hypothetical protein
VLQSWKNVLLGIDAADVYIDDVGAYSSSWKHLIEPLSTALQHLYDNGLFIYWLNICGLTQ